MVVLQCTRSVSDCTTGKGSVDKSYSMWIKCTAFLWFAAHEFSAEAAPGRLHSIQFSCVHHPPKQTFHSLPSVANHQSESLASQAKQQQSIEQQNSPKLCTRGESAQQKASCTLTGAGSYSIGMECCRPRQLELYASSCTEGKDCYTPP